MSQNAHNPYEDADPIPTSPRMAPRERPAQATSPSRTRSRAVQSARDAAPRPNTQTGPAARTAPPQYREGYRPAASPGSARRRQPRQQNVRRRQKAGIGIVVGAIVAAIVALSFLLYWINRPVPVTVNGESAEVRIGSKLEDVLHEERIAVNPGNYVTVGGNLLAVNQGYAFTATVNGQTLSDEEAKAYRIGGTESIEFTDGGDAIEEFTAETEPVPPVLRMEGEGYALQYISQWGRAGERERRVGKVSGETATVTTVEPQDCVITCRDLVLPEDKRYVAITFDDGPISPYTEQYLDILARYGVKATFFNLGDNIQANPDLARRIVAEGHQLANHTMSHNQLTAVDGDTIYNQITTSATVIEQTTGVRSSHLRPPYGDFTERSWLATRGSVTAAIRWTGDSEDWRLPGVERIVENSLLNLHPGTIILMHDGGGDRAQDVEALPLIIERLQAEGYQIVTMADLMRAAGDIPEDVCSGTATMPADATWPQEISPEDIAAASAA